MRIPCAPFFDVRSVFRRVVELGEAESRIESDASRKRKGWSPALPRDQANNFLQRRAEGDALVSTRGIEKS